MTDGKFSYFWLFSTLDMITYAYGELSSVFRRQPEASNWMKTICMYIMKLKKYPKNVIKYKNNIFGMTSK